MIAAAGAALLLAPTNAAAQAPRFRIPASADQLIIVSSPTYDPPRHIASLRAYQRTGPSTPWHLTFGPYPAELGYGNLRDHRREGDGSTPTGTYAMGTRIYGNRSNPGGLNYAYHHLACGDWWDEDPYSPRYNQFVHVACGVTPGFAAGSEALWTEPVPYPFFAVIRFNVDPTQGGRTAPGSAIFLHSWVDGPTAGCVALPRTRLLAILRWLDPHRHPVIEIGTDREAGPIPASS
jgi:L,D-peptidoglycan transpeptidase YkuD (ErfK/YbiS/YcfS/YnhG family)